MVTPQPLHAWTSWIIDHQVRVVDAVPMHDRSELLFEITGPRRIRGARQVTGVSQPLVHVRNQVSIRLLVATRYQRRFLESRSTDAPYSRS